MYNNGKLEKVTQFSHVVFVVSFILGNGIMSRSLSESDLSELDGVAVTRREPKQTPETSSGQNRNTRYVVSEFRQIRRSPKKYP